MSKVVVYGKKSCVQCQYTKEYLDNMGVDYEYIDVLKHNKGSYVRETFNTNKLPVVARETELIAIGFQPDILNDLK